MLYSPFGILRGPRGIMLVWGNAGTRGVIMVVSCLNRLHGLGGERWGGGVVCSWPMLA